MLKQSFFLLICIVSRLNLASGDLWKIDGSSKYAPQCDFSGNDIVTVKKETRKECIDLCQNTNECTNYLHYSDKREVSCFLKRGNKKENDAFFDSNFDSSLVCGIMMTLNYRDIIFSNIKSFAYAPGGCISPITLPDSNAFVNTQPIFAYPTSSDLFIAGSRIGKGKLLVETSLGFINNINSNTLVIQNLRKWLSSSNTDIPSSQIIDIQTLETNNLAINNYKIVTWSIHSTAPKEATISSLIPFINNGGGLICSGVFWTIANFYQSSMFAFVQKNTGLVIVGSKWCPNGVLPNRDLVVGENKASQYLSTTDLMKILLASNLKTLSDSALNPILEDFDAINIMQSTLNLRILSNTQVSDFYKNLNNLIKSSFGKTLAPSKSTSISGALNLKLVKIINHLLTYGIQGVKAPNVNLWPGDLTVQSSLLSNVQLSFKAKLKNEYIPTGYYVPPGVDLKIEVKSMNDIWNVKIGVEEYNLWNSVKYDRYPNNFVKRVLIQSKVNTISSAFGGLLYFQSPLSGSLNVLVSNVVKSPYLDLADQQSINAFNNQLQSSSVPWTELAGKRMVFSIPTKIAKLMSSQDNTLPLKFYDQLVESFFQLRGSDINTEIRRRYIPNIQIWEGAELSTLCVESGCFIDQYMKDYTSIDTQANKLNPRWLDYNYIKSVRQLINSDFGQIWNIMFIFHELGHSMERNEWVFVEATNEIFTLYGLERMLGMNITYVVTQIKGMPPFVYVAHYWTQRFGWPTLQKFFSNYEIDIANKAPSLPKTNQDKIDQWCIRYSKIVGGNVILHLQAYGIKPNSNLINQQLSGLPVLDTKGMLLPDFTKPSKQHL